MNSFYTKLNETLQQGENVVMATAVDCLGFLDGDREALIAQKAFLCGDELTAETPSMKDFWQATFSSTPEELPGLFGQDTWWTFFEPVTPRRQLVLCGGGHIAQPLAQMGAMLDFDVTVIDDREEFANTQRFPQAKQVLCMPFDKALEQVPHTECTYFVIITRGHKDDRLCLEHVLKQPFGYAGMIGSHKKVSVVMEALEQQGFDKTLLNKVHAPIGLSIGAQTPAEIAVCIAAQLIQTRSGTADSSFPVQALEKLAAGESMVMATVINKHGSSPRGVGAKMLIDQEGNLYGTIGGGAAEAKVIEAAPEVRLMGYPIVMECAMTNEDAQSDGMVCGGTIRVLLDPIN